jgi:plastocyanin
MIHIGFELAEKTDPTYGPVYFYSTLLNNSAQVIRVKAGSHIVFVNDDPSSTPHTASGFGMSGFPNAFDNSSGFNRAGSTINGSLTWSTGSLLPGQRSQVFTVGPPGVYYFGCGYHYSTKPTTTNGSMGDVLVSS